MQNRRKSRSHFWLIVLLTLLAAFFAVWLKYLRPARSQPRADRNSVAAAFPTNAPGSSAAPLSQAPAAVALPPGNSASAVSRAPGPAFLSSNVPSFTNAFGGLSPGALKEIAALEAEKNRLTPVQQKIDSQLLYAEKMRQGNPIAPGVRTQLVHLDQDSQGRVLLDIKALVSDALLRQIRALGGDVINSFPAFKAVRARVPLAEVEKLAEAPDILFVRPAVRSLRNTVDVEGEYAHGAPAARAAFGADGTGVKVGVLSDSVDYLESSEVAGKVTVLPGQSGLGMGGYGEGTAMLEIVRDLAPGAQLFFATAFSGEAQFASNILDLRFTYGCDIIVDDFTYFDESPFQDGVIAQAVNAVTASGGLYFSSAANSGNLDSGTSGTWEGDFVDGGPAGPVIGSGRVHSFGSALYNIVISGSSGPDTVLFWSDPLGASTNDYDLFILDSSGSSVISSSVNIQNGFQDPYENVVAPASGCRVVILQASGTSRFLHLDTQRGMLAIATAGSTRGHNAPTNGFSVAAVDAAETPYPNPFAGGSQDTVETFSSDGPRRMFYFPDGTPITPGNFSSTGGAVYLKPDVAAADGVTTDVPGFAPFFGTSAAAPHAAAIAALLKSHAPGLSAAQVRSILTGTALDIMAAGNDRDAGAGIVMPQAALNAAFSDSLAILPACGFIAGGPAGGPFAPAAQSLILTNMGTVLLDWTLGDIPAWLDVAVPGGSLPPGATATVAVTLDPAAAAGLPAGAYRAAVAFTNQNNGVVQNVPFILIIQTPPQFSTYGNLATLFGALAYWRLDETNPPPPLPSATNAGSLGPAADGVALDGVALGQPGVLGSSFRFFNPALFVTHAGSHVDIPYQPALNPGGAFSVEFWVNPSQFTTDLFCPACALDTTLNGGGSRCGWLFYQNSAGAWEFRLGGISGYIQTLAGGMVQTSAWEHIVGVYDGVNASLYVNGQLVSGPVAVSGFQPNTHAPVRLGATTIPNRGYDGSVDEFAIYSSALSAGQIAAHYSAVTTNAAGYAAQILNDNAAGYWRLDDRMPAIPAPVAFNSGSASNVYGLYQAGSVPGVAGVPVAGLGTNNHACRFNGSIGYIDVPGSALDITGPLTVTAWAKSDPANGAVRALLSGGETSYRLNMDGSGFPRFADGLQSIGELAGSTRIDDGAWHHLAGVYDGVSAEYLYVDGQVAASTAGATVPIAGSPGDVWIGAAPDYGNTRIFSGVIDEVAIFASALTPLQIQQLYSATNSPPAVTAIPSSGSIQFSWGAALNRSYQLEYKTNLAEPGWHNLGLPITATNVTMTTVDNIGQDPQRFYRIVLLP